MVPVSQNRLGYFHPEAVLDLVIMVPVNRGHYLWIAMLKRLMVPRMVPRMVPTWTGSLPYLRIYLTHLRGLRHLSARKKNRPPIHLRDKHARNRHRYLVATALSLPLALLKVRWPRCRCGQIGALGIKISTSCRRAVVVLRRGGRLSLKQRRLRRRRMSARPAMRNSAARLRRQHAEQQLMLATCATRTDASWVLFPRFVRIYAGIATTCS